MIPYLLAALGGYLIGNSSETKKFADGGTILSEDGRFIKVVDYLNVGANIVFDAQKKYIEDRNKIMGRAMGASDFESLLKKHLSAENLVSQKILPPEYIDYHFSFVNTKSFDRPHYKDSAKKLASRLEGMGYKTIIVPSVIVPINMNEPELGTYLVYTNVPVTKNDALIEGVYAEGGLTQSKPSPKRVANKLMKIESGIWDELNIQSGSQLYGDDELQKKYVKELEKSGADKMINQVDAKKVMDALEDNNYSSLYTYFVFRGVLGKSKRDLYVDMYNDGGSYMFLNPNLIQPK